MTCAGGADQCMRFREKGLERERAADARIGCQPQRGDGRIGGALCGVAGARLAGLVALLIDYCGENCRESCMIEVLSASQEHQV